MNDNVFWDRVKMLLKAHKMTQKQFAQMINIPLSTLYRWLHFNTVPDTYTVYAIAVSLGVTSNYLLGGEEKDIEYRRLSELAAREALSKVEDIAQLILEEAGKIKPLKKVK